MSLAKQILDNKRKADEVKTDEFGIPMKDEAGKDISLRPDYLVARALLTEQKNPDYNPATTHRLHKRDGMLYNYDKEVIEDHKNFYQLTGVDYQVPLHIREVFWAKLKNTVPTLDTTMYQICDGLWWDKKSGGILQGDYNEISKKAGK